MATYFSILAWINAEKSSDKIQYLFMKKTLHTVSIEGTYPNIIKAIYDKPIASIILNSETENISFKIRNKTRMSTLTTFIHRSFGSPSHSNQRRRKGIQSGKEDVKLSLFEDDMIPCKENSNDAIRKLLELINKSD